PKRVAAPLLDREPWLQYRMFNIRTKSLQNDRVTERRNALLFPETAARAVKAARMFKEIQRSVCGRSRMSPEKNRLFRIFAPFSLGFFLTTGVVAAPPWNAAEPTASVKRQSASAQFARAEEQRAALNAKPSERRTLADYKQVVMSYRRVAWITPRAPEVPDSLLAAAELYTEMGDRFGRSYYQSAVDSYEFLVREYAAHKYCQEALLRIAKLQRDQLAETAQAQRTYEEFLKRFPRSPKKREVEEALAELALLQNSQ